MLSSFATILCTSLLAGVAIAQAPNANFTQDQISRTLRETPQTELCRYLAMRHVTSYVKTDSLTLYLLSFLVYWSAQLLWYPLQWKYCSWSEYVHYCKFRSLVPNSIIYTILPRKDHKLTRLQSQAALNYTCTCAANNSAPALQFYEPTITSFICNVVLGDCLKDHVSDQASQDNCKKTIVCGSSNVTTFQASAAPSAAATTSGASPSGTGSSSETSGTASTSTPSASPTSGAIALNFGQQYGVGVLSAGLLAIMGLAL